MELAVLMKATTPADTLQHGDWGDLKKVSEMSVSWISAAIPFKARLNVSFEEAYIVFERTGAVFGDHV